MTQIGWNFSGTDEQCSSYGGGHWVHWIQHKVSVREPGPAIPVRAAVDDRGVILSTAMGFRSRVETPSGAGVSHPTAVNRSLSVEAALATSRGADSRPGRRGEQHVRLVTHSRRHECRIVRTTNPDHLIVRQGVSDECVASPSIRPIRGGATAVRPFGSPRE
jgi:hypothetical protein